MTPAPGGRHCAACNKIVVDFTVMTEVEVVAALRQPGRVCGRFRSEQLTTHDTPAGGWARWLAAAAVTLSACETNPPATIPPDSDSVPTSQSVATLRVQGRVVDATSGRPLSGTLIISEEDTSWHTRTRADGTFALQLPQRLRGTRLVAAQPMPSDLRPTDPEPGFYIPRYFKAEDGSPVVVRLRNPGPMIGQPTLEPQENYSPAVMPRILHLAPPPPPPTLSN